MMIMIVITLLVLILLQIIVVVSSSPSIWPHPTIFKYSASNSLVVVSSSLIFHTNGNSTTLNQAYQRYRSIIFKHTTTTTTTTTTTSSTTTTNSIINDVTVHTDDITEFYPQYDTNESYTLTITTSSIIITSKNIYGALRALESLSQLIQYDYDTKSYIIDSIPILIKDTPRYRHRGLLLDTSRHYLPVDFIKHTIDAMSYSKLNVFHFHIVDTQSFPFESLTYPLLWSGSYSKSERYSHDDIVDIVEYARLRGVKVMIEFDMPGHAASWCTGYPSICPSTTCLQPLDPSNEDTFTLINSLLGECTGNEKGKGIFPYEFIHLGGDEVDYSCWEKSEKIQAWEKANDLNGSEDTYEYFVDRAASIARSQSRTPVQWVEVYEHFGNKLSNDTVVHVWKEKSTMTNIIKDGYRTILSDQDVWYLDHIDVTWEEFYNNEPTALLPKDANVDLILGGEVCMWGEKVDSSDLDNTIWPRAAAFGERMWSTKETTLDDANHDSTQARLEQFRCLLQQRSIGAAPVTNAAARESPSSPGSCFVQRKK